MTTQPPACGKISEARLRQLCVAVEYMPLGDTEARDLLAIIDAYRHPAPVADMSGGNPNKCRFCGWFAGSHSPGCIAPAPVADELAEVEEARICADGLEEYGAVMAQGDDALRDLLTKSERLLRSLSAQPSGALEREDVELPRTQCPKCKALIEDADGFGVLYHRECGYCTHASSTNDVCDFCGAGFAPPPERAPGGYALNMDDLSDARAYFEKAYRFEATTFPGTSKIAAGQYRRYADAVAIAAIRLSRAPPPSSSPSATADATLRAALEKDAARYRWLRSKGAWKHVDPPDPSGISVYWEYGAESDENDPRLDAVIDAALAGNEGKS